MKPIQALSAILLLVWMVLSAAILFFLFQQERGLASNVQAMDISVNKLLREDQILVQNDQTMERQMQSEMMLSQETLDQQSKWFNTLQLAFQNEYHQFGQTINQLSTVKSKAAAVSVPAGEQVAAGYKIYGVEPYGVVISTPAGGYFIARIGRQIGQLGVIQSISATQVVAGSYVIN